MPPMELLVIGCVIEIQLKILDYGETLHNPNFNPLGFEGVEMPRGHTDPDDTEVF